MSLTAQVSRLLRHRWHLLADLWLRLAAELPQAQRFAALEALLQNFLTAQVRRQPGQAAQP